MSPLLLVVLLVVALALAFDYSNGFHDAANSIATVIATRVLKPYQAVAWAALFNFLAIFSFEQRVAKAIWSGTIRPDVADVNVIMACLIGAVAWNITTWYLGLPTSSSHALVGGLVGAGMAKAGMHAIVVPGVTKTVEFIILAPLIGMLLGITLMSTALFALRDAHPGPVTRWSRLLQLASSAFYSLGHGLNDAQKTMGVIALLLISMRAKVPELEHLGPWFMPGPGSKQVPLGIVLAAQTAIALGTLSGGWRIVRTMGMRITELSPLGGVCAETAGAITLIMVSRSGIPVSTTHTITGAIVGVGASRRLSAVRWGVAGHIVWAWVLTIPCAALMSAGAYLVAGRLWPVLPGAAQLLLGLLLLAGLGYGLVTWLRSSAAGKLAHA